MTVLTIHLPLPDVGLTPNGRAMFWAKARLTKDARHMAEIRGRNARIAYGLTKPLTPPVTASLLFVFKTSRRHDQDNLVSGLKPSFDGLVDARVLIDDSLGQLRINPPATTVAGPGQTPEVIITLWGSDDLSPLAQRLVDTLEKTDA